MTAPARTASAPVDVASAVARAVTSLSDVARLDDGVLGEIATYGQRRRVGGIRIHSEQPLRIAVHVVVLSGRPVPEIAEEVRAAASAAVDRVDSALAGAVIDVDITDLEVRRGVR